MFGGAIQDAGAVKARADQRKATSDWMEIEKQRGISVTSTVLSFEYKQYHINLLDTPGHQDFSEDTYRTLAAADNCVMLVDGAKGIEDRTRKLFEVCRMRRLPIFSFVNKMDRPSLSPFELMDQLEKEFKIDLCPMVIIDFCSRILTSYFISTATARIGLLETGKTFKACMTALVHKCICFSEEIGERDLQRM